MFLLIQALFLKDCDRHTFYIHLVSDFEEVSKFDCLSLFFSSCGMCDVAVAHKLKMSSFCVVMMSQFYIKARMSITIYTTSRFRSTALARLLAKVTTRTIQEVRSTM